MLYRSKIRHLPRPVAALAAGAVFIVLFARQAKSPAVQRPKPLSAVEQKLVGTWAYPREQFGENITITFSEDRIYKCAGSDAFIHPAHWRIEGTDLIVEQKVKTVVGGSPTLQIPDAVRRLQLPEALWHIDRTTQALSFSDSGGLQLSGVWPACTLTRCEAPEDTLRSDKGAAKP